MSDFRLEDSEFEDAPCRFCRLAQAIHSRVPTIFGTSDLCDDCLGEYREQVARAVDQWNQVGSR